MHSRSGIILRGIPDRRLIGDGKMNEKAVIVVVKNPEPGKVKRRLIPILGSEGSAYLYSAFIKDILSSLREMEPDLLISCYPPEKYQDLTEIVGDERLFPQRGKDLGERLYNSLRYVFDMGYEKVLIICSDCPDLPPEYVNRAFSSLDDHHSVLGPAEDGGYYLIGFRKGSLVRSAFIEIPMSTPMVAEMTLSRLNEEGQKTAVIDRWRDVDLPRDLFSLKSKYKDGSGPTHTMKALEELLGGEDINSPE